MKTLREQYDEILSEMTLVQVLDQQKFKAFYLQHATDRTRVNSCLIMSTPEGISITGDLAPGVHGIFSAFGYSVAWFGGRLSGGYLNSKFLSKSFHSENAVVDLEDELEEEMSKEATEVFKALIIDLKYGDASEHHVYDALVELGYDTSEYHPGWGYDPSDVALLGAIQARFAELFE